MAQATFSVRMDQNLKTRFSEICENIGMNMSTAINIFANAVVNKRKIPFDIEAPTDDHLQFLQVVTSMRNKVNSSKMNNMSLDEINAIIKDVRGKKAKKK